MIHTKNNPKKVEHHYKLIKTFTGFILDIDNIRASYKDGKLHSFEDEPAVVTEYCSIWYYNGLIHRENNPAIVYHTGAVVWFHHGKISRIDGPAMISHDGKKKWYLNDEIHGLNSKFTNESWARFVNLKFLE